MPALDLAQKTLAPLALSLFAFFPPQAPGEPEAAPAAPELSGRFRLNETESEDPRAALAKPLDGRRPPGVRPGGLGGGRRPGGGPRGDGPGESGLRGWLEGVKAMTVTHTRNEIAVMEDDGRLRTLHPDGKAYKSKGGAAEVKARWDGERLVVETKPERGPRVTESWSLDAGTGKLTIEVKLDGPRGGLSYRRVYDREAAES